MLRSTKVALAMFSLVAMTATGRATELHTFDFSGSAIAGSLNGLSGGSYTSVGTADEITLDIEANLGVLDFTSASGSLGIDASTSSSTTTQSITLDFSSLSGSPLRVHSITMTSIMEIGSPVYRTLEFFIDPQTISQSVYRYDNSQWIELGSYNVPETGQAELHVNNLQYGYHSLHSVIIASDSFGGPGVPEPTTALLLLVGTYSFGIIRFRKKIVS